MEIKTLPELMCSVYGHEFCYIAKFKRNEGGSLSYIEGSSRSECSKCGLVWRNNVPK